MDLHADLTVVWALILAFAIFVYVALDGFDLGLGILYPLFPEKRDRDVMMNSVAPVWDGNETWLVLGGGGLFAAFPLAYSILMPALYPLIIAMLLALVFRGVAFEFRWRSRTPFSAWAWDAAFIGGSAIAAFTQGVILGAILQGISVTGRAYSGGWWDWLSPFSLVCGVAVICGYALLGACWLNLKAIGDLQARARRIGRGLAFVTLGFIAVVSLWTPFLGNAYWLRWFSWPQIVVTAPIPLAVGLLALALLRSLQREGRDWLPLILALGLFLLCFVGLGVSIWPFVVPTAVTIWEAASPQQSQLFMLVGVVVMIPIILGYTTYAYWVFRGKQHPDQGYH